jgi:antitoxin MazE
MPKGVLCPCQGHEYERSDIGRNGQRDVFRRLDELDRQSEGNYNVTTIFFEEISMRARIVRIGNSQGIRLPKPIIEQAGISEDVDIVVEDEKIIIRPISKPRAGWDEAFREMAEKDDDLLIDMEQPTSRWDETEWQW